MLVERPDQVKNFPRIHRPAPPPAAILPGAGIINHHRRRQDPGARGHRRHSLHFCKPSYRSKFPSTKPNTTQPASRARRRIVAPAQKPSQAVTGPTESTPNRALRRTVAPDCRTAGGAEDGWQGESRSHGASLPAHRFHVVASPTGPAEKQMPEIIFHQIAPPSHRYHPPADICRPVRRPFLPSRMAFSAASRISIPPTHPFRHSNFIIHYQQLTPIRPTRKTRHILSFLPPIS